MEDEKNTFEQELTTLINAWSIDNDLGMPDYVLARHMLLSLTLFSESFEAVFEHFNADLEDADTGLATDADEEIELT